MKKSKKIIVSLFSLFVLGSTSVNAGGKGVIPAVIPVEPIPMVDPVPFYVGAGLIWGQYNGCPTGNGCVYEDVTYGAMLRAGYEWNQYVGIEARYMQTVWEADPLGGQELEHIGLFIKPSYPLSDDFNVYGLVGYGWTKTTTGGNGNLPTVDDYGFSAGIGIEFDLSGKEDDKEENGNYDRVFDGQGNQEKGWGLFIDYQRLLIDSNIPDMDVISIGISYDF